MRGFKKGFLEEMTSGLLGSQWDVGMEGVGGVKDWVRVGLQSLWALQLEMPS